MSEEHDDRFSESPMSRRRFMRLSAATGAALSLPGNATADAASEKFDAEYSTS
jgi:Ni,Fe-hydrogenase I small subunit